MELYGRKWTRRELEARVGRLEQIGGIKRVLGAEGAETGVELIQVRTGAGLSYIVSPTKGLDISLAEFGGSPISWQSPNGDAHPSAYDGEGSGWLRTASGGLLMTCGLSNVGSPSSLQGRTYGMHGRVHHLSASHVCAEGRWDEDHYTMNIRGQVDETSIFGSHLRMYREVRSRLGQNTIEIIDTLENAGYQSAPHMMLYHFNFGFPLLDERTVMQFPSERVNARDKGTPAEGYDIWESPENGYRERVYYHELPQGKDSVHAELYQPAFPVALGTVPLRVRLTWSSKTLPRLVQWKMAGEREHVLGIEPSNCGVEGIAAEQNKGTLTVLQPGGRVRYQLRLDLSSGTAEGSSDL
ncbi:DUF4432 family protein [Paenibacillus gansuensis]|uniref:DUF4432 family protein n=1 Tax=Paenibacillus gansuensis TaxID=306542 RepID=A0ABW5PE02_9BACL